LQSRANGSLDDFDLISKMKKRNDVFLVLRFLLATSLKNDPTEQPNLRSILMVYCTKCGAKNEDTAEVCVKCGAPLVPPRAYPLRRVRREAEEVCFGIPKPWFLPFIGVAIILAGIFSLLEQIVPGMPSVWPLIVILFGILIILAVLYRPKR